MFPIFYIFQIWWQASVIRLIADLFAIFAQKIVPSPVVTFITCAIKLYLANEVTILAL